MTARPGADPGELAPSLRNLRDVGGLATADGREVRTGVLYRSATPAFLDAGQIRALTTALDIRTRVDLRSAVEVAEVDNDDLAAAPWAVAHLPIRSGATWHAQPRDVPVAERVAGHYLRYLEHSADSVVAVARLVASPERTPALLHCSAGKDRTGVVLAVLLSAVGVTDEEVVSDYARTHDHLAGVFEQLRSLPAYRARLDELPEESFTAEAASMERFLVRLREEYGGARTYLTRRGVEPRVLERLAAALLS